MLEVTYLDIENYKWKTNQSLMLGSQEQNVLCGNARAVSSVPNKRKPISLSLYLFLWVCLTFSLELRRG